MRPEYNARIASARYESRADMLILQKLREHAPSRRCINEAVDYWTDVHGYHHGQTDGTIHAKPAGSPTHDENDRPTSIGQLNFSIYGGRAKIHHIGVADAHQRKGVASGLYAELLKSHPHHEIDWGGMTPDGVKLKAAMDAKHGGYIRDARVQRGLERARRRSAGGYAAYGRT